jgi:hypothetical protein
LGRADYVTAALADDGSVGLAFVPSPHEPTVDFVRLKGKVTARWFDPTNGKTTTIGGTPIPEHGKQSFTTPGKNAAGDGDFVLILEAEG